MIAVRPYNSLIRVLRCSHPKWNLINIKCHFINVERRTLIFNAIHRERIDCNSLQNIILFFRCLSFIQSVYLAILGPSSTGPLTHMLLWCQMRQWRSLNRRWRIMSEKKIPRIKWSTGVFPLSAIKWGLCNPWCVIRETSWWQAKWYC